MTIHSEKFGCGPLWVNQQLTKLDKKLLEAQNLNIVNIANVSKKAKFLVSTMSFDSSRYLVTFQHPRIWKKMKWVSQKIKHKLRKPRRVFRLPTSDFQLPTSDFRLPTSVAIKGGDIGLHDFYLMLKCCLFQKRFFSLLLGRLCPRRFWLSRLFHIEKSWHTYRFTVVFVSGRQDLPSGSRAYSLKLFITAE